MHDVFINYRTGDGDRTAITIERDLVRRFGEGKAFRASASIRPGEKYPERLLSGVRRSGVLLAVIGPQWSRHPALHDKDDWVRREILEAFACGVPVMPVLDGRRTERLNPADLPEELAGLADLQSMPLDLQQDAEPGLTRIARRITEYVPSLKEADSTASPSPAPGSVSNSVGDVNGTAVQNRDVTGDVGNVIKGDRGSIHTGKGDINNNSPRFSGDGATYVAGDNQGGIRHQFGGRRRNEDDVR
ncbi:toll/interleukin-1 receptor domain-containing protein [Sphaerisporangium sp. NPDC049002]|uniref:toll/interleukin-1 receptor domain-containing protein n=1 Tax=Sphaerisporangium sp. NPDC049002 TaxID=3155392 RepID=UPI0033F5FFE9